MQRSTIRYGLAAGAAIVGAFVAGASFVYFFDPQSGKRRRARIRDEIVHAEHATLDGLRKEEHSLENRSRGFLARLASIFRSKKADDDVVIERIRAKLGHVCTHPHDIEVHAKGGGRYELYGAVLTPEHAPIVQAIEKVPGVRGIADALIDRETDAEVFAFRGSSAPAAFARVTGPV